MAKFLIAFHGGKHPESKEAGMAHMQAWNKWLDDMGDAALDRGQYLGMSKTVSQDGVANDGGSNPIQGVMTMQADDEATALALCAKCPHITSMGGTIEIAPIMEM